MALPRVSYPRSYQPSLRQLPLARTQVEAGGPLTDRSVCRAAPTDRCHQMISWAVVIHTIACPQVLSRTALPLSNAPMPPVICRRRIHVGGEAPCEVNCSPRPI